jgi:ATP-dependent Clp protease adaptor protein ClpS
LSGTGPGEARRPEPETREKTARPRRWKVVLLNDDYTTMEFVVEILESVFRHSPAEAAQIMMKVHKQGRGVAGVFPHDVAETKLRIVHRRARAAGFPLRGKLEEE